MSQPNKTLVARFFPKLLLLGFIIGHGFVLVWPAITEFNDGRFLLHMDERISYDQIKPVTQARGPVDLIVALVGSDFRYGRLMYVLPASFAGVAEVFWGERGFISSIRLFFYLSILASALLVFKMGRYSLASALAAITIMSLPYTEYFATLPKPDAPQVLCLLIGLLALSKHRPLIAGLFIGLAMGFKLSSLFALPVLAVWLASSAIRTRLGATPNKPDESQYMADYRRLWPLHVSQCADTAGYPLWLGSLSSFHRGQFYAWLRHSGAAHCFMAQRLSTSRRGIPKCRRFWRSIRLGKRLSHSPCAQGAAAKLAS